MVNNALYIHPGMNSATKDYAIIPMGAIGLVNLIRTLKWEVHGINVPLTLSLEQSFALEDEVRRFMPIDLILIDLHWYMNTAGVIATSRMVRKVAQNALIVVGGLTATHFDQELLEICADIDVVIRGDAEIAIQYILWSIEKRKLQLNNTPNVTYRSVDGRIARSPAIAKTEQKLFNTLDYVSLDWLEYQDKYYFTRISGFLPNATKRYWLEVGRGCFFNCSICGGGIRAHQELLNLPRPLFRNVDKILDDMEKLAILGIEQVAFSHDIFTLGFPRTEQLLEGMRRRRIKMGLFHEFWRLPKREMIDQIFTAFDPECSELSISPETGNEQIRKRNFRGKYSTNDEYLEWVRYIKILPISALEVYFTANLPWETTATWGEAINLMERIVDIYGYDGMVAYAGFITIDPMSPMWLFPDRFEVFRQINRLADYYHMTLRGHRVPGYRSKHLSQEGLVSNLERFRERMMSK